MVTLSARATGTLLFVVASCTAASCGDDERQRKPPTNQPIIQSVTPDHGAFATRVTITGPGLGVDGEETVVTFSAPAQGRMQARPSYASADTIEVLVPAVAAEQAELTVTVAGVTSEVVPFTIEALADPTPAAAGNELSAFYAELDATLSGMESLLTGVVAAQLESAGQADTADRVRHGASELRPAFTEVASRLSANQAGLELSLLDAVLDSPAMLATRAELRAAAAAMGVVLAPGRSAPQPMSLIGAGDFTGDTVDSINEVRRVLRRMRDLLDDLDTALLVAEVAAAGAAVIPGFTGLAGFVPVLHEIRVTVLEPVAALLDTVIPLLGTMPTRAVGGTFEVRVVANDLELDQSFGSMQSPIPPESGPGAFLVLEPYGVKGYVAFENDGGDSLAGLGAELAPELSRVAEALLELADFDVGRIQVDSVEIETRLVSSDPEAVTGTFTDSVLWIEASRPGLAAVTIRGDLAQVQETCPALLACIPAAQIEVTRVMSAVSGDQTEAPCTMGPRVDMASVAGRAPRTAYIGDTLLITGEAFSRDPQLAHQDVHFEPAPGYPLSGLAWSTFQRSNDYDGFTTEVPDALPGELTVWIEDHASNPIDFTILPPRLDPPPPSGIAGEYWHLTGEGFSATPAHNALDWAGARSSPEAGGHRDLELVVPADAASGPFKVVTLDALESQSHQVVARKFSEPAILSAPDRLGLRPAVSRDGSSGDRLLAWVDRNAKGAQQLVVAVAPAGAGQVGSPMVLPATLGGHPAAPPKPAVAAAAGRYFVAWVEAAASELDHDRVLMARSDDGSTWSAPAVMSAHAGPARQPVLAADGSTVVLAWVAEPAAVGGEASLAFRVSSDGGDSFSGAWTWSDDDVTDPAVAASGNAIAVAWSASDANGRAIVVTRSEDLGANFQAPWRLGSSSPGLARHPSVAVGPSCTTPSLASLYVAWEQMAYDAPEDVMFARIDGAVAAAQNVTRTAAHSQAPVVTVDSDCIPALAWLELGHGEETLLANGADRSSQPHPASLRFARSFDGGATWNPRPLTLASLSNGSRLGHLAMAAGGQAAITVVWQEDFGASPVIAMRTTDGDGAAPAAQPAPPAGEAGADLVYRGIGVDLWVSSPSGARAKRVGVGLGASTAPGISPDGRFIAYVPGLDRMVIAEADGAHPLGLVRTADFVWRGAAAWSPRGDFIAVGSPYAAPTLGWVAPDSTELNLVGFGEVPCIGGFSGRAPWSPSGSLAFSNDGVLGHLDPRTGTVTALSAALPTGTSAYYPSWSPDGAALAFIVTATPPSAWPAGTLGVGDLYTYDVTLGTLTRLTDSGLDTTPVWSPDGRRVAFVRGGASHRQVHVQAVDGAIGSDVSVSADLLGADDVEPVFLPDGSGIVVLRRDPSGGPWTSVAIDLATSAVTALAPEGAGGAAVCHLGARPTWAGDASAVVSETGTTSVSLSWQGASDDVGVDHYEVWDGDTKFQDTAIAEASLTGLTPGATYTFTIRACDAAGNCSLSGPTVHVTTSTPGAAPTWSSVPPLLESVMGGSYDGPYHVEVTWTTANEPDVEYRLYVDGAHVGTNLYQGNMRRLDRLRPQTSYTATVQACFVGGACTTDGPSYAFTTMADTTAPAFGSASVGGVQARLVFQEPLDATSVPDAADFTVEVRDDVGAMVPVAVTGVVVEEHEMRVLLGLASTIYAGDVVSVSYTPGATPLRNAGGLPAEPLSTTGARNLSWLRVEAAGSDAAGSLVIAGAISGHARFGAHALENAGQSDVFAAKRGPGGAWLWALRFGGVEHDSAFAVALDATGGAAVAGAFSGELSLTTSRGPVTLTANGATDAFVAKLDASGQLDWIARAGGVGSMVPGEDSDVFDGGFVEAARAVAVDAQGNVYAGGQFGWTATFGGSAYTLSSAGQKDAWVGKLDASGAWQWATRAGGDAGSAYWAADVVSGLAVDASDVFAVGTFQNTIDFPGLPSGLSVFFSPGSAAPGLFVAKLDRDAGQWLWADDNGQMGGLGNSLVLDGSGGVVVGGAASTFLGSPQPYVGKWSSNGAVAWERVVVGYGSVEALGVDAGGMVLAAGVGAQGMDFDGTVLGSTYGFIASVAPADGAFAWALGEVYSSDVDLVAAVGCNTNGACVVGNVTVPEWQSTVSYDFGALNSSTGGEIDVFIAAAASPADAPPTGAWTALTGSRDPP